MHIKKRESCATIGFWRVRYEALSRMTSSEIFQDYCLGVLEFFGAQSSTLFQVMKFFDLLQNLLSCHCCSLRQRNEGYDREVKSSTQSPAPSLFPAVVRETSPQSSPENLARRSAGNRALLSPCLFNYYYFKALRLLKEFLTNIGLFLLEEDRQARSKQQNE